MGWRNPEFEFASGAHYLAPPPSPVRGSMATEAAWGARLAAYKDPDLKRSVWQLANAALLFAGAWALMYASLGVGYWLTLLLAVPAAFLLVRLFIIQHDCGHGAFFRSPRVADVVGSILGVLTLTPYHYWKKTHAIHHATSGNLEHRGFGDIDTLTVDEYLARSRWERFKYRVYRSQRDRARYSRSEEHTSELQSLAYLVCRLLLEKKKENMSR